MILQYTYTREYYDMTFIDYDTFRFGAYSPLLTQKTSRLYISN